MEHFYEILWGIIGTIGSGLAAWLVVVITNWLNSKIKDKKLAKIATDIFTLIMTVVQRTYQVYVEALKARNAFGTQEQQNAKDAAINEIKQQLTVEQKEYIASISTNIEEWIGMQIEAVIYQLKNK